MTVDLAKAGRVKAVVSDSLRLDRIPPHSTEAEQGVLGCVMLDPVLAMAECRRARVEPAAFYDLRHQGLFEAMCAIADGKAALDLVTLATRLKDAHRLEDCGGLAYIAALADSVPSASNVRHYLDILVEKKEQRALVHACTQAVSLVYEGGEHGHILAEAERTVLAVRGRSGEETPGVKDLVLQAIERIEKVQSSGGQIGGLATGLVDLDRVSDGLHGPELVVLAGFPSSGKTALAMGVAHHAGVQLGKRVAVFSLEMSAVDLVVRMIMAESRVDLRDVRDGLAQDRDFVRMSEAATRLTRSRLHFDDISDMSVWELRSKARRLWQDGGLDLVVVDYLQLLNAEGSSRRMDSRQEEVTQISRGLKAMSKELAVPVLVLSQITDEGKLRESRAIGQDADSVWKLAVEPDQDAESGGYAVTLHVEKNRSGPAPAKVPLTFIKRWTRFESCARVAEEGQ